MAWQRDDVSAQPAIDFGGSKFIDDDDAADYDDEEEEEEDDVDDFDETEVDDFPAANRFDALHVVQVGPAVSKKDLFQTNTCEQKFCFNKLQLTGLAQYHDLMHDSSPNLLFLAPDTDRIM
jgi:hypothetical protein